MQKSKVDNPKIIEVDTENGTILRILTVNPFDHVFVFTNKRKIHFPKSLAQNIYYYMPLDY